MGLIEERVKKLLKEIPPHVTVVAAAKTRTAEEIEEAIRGGIRIIGENYVQETRKVKEKVSLPCEWHMIGHLQTNKVKHALKLFSMIQTLDSLKLAEALEKRCRKEEKEIRVLVEVNIAHEPQKFGIPPEDVFDFLEKLREFPHIKVCGLMTMGPPVPDPEEIRPLFRRMRELFERARERFSGIEILSMGMSDTYKIAIEEGSNMVRIGTAIFGRRR